MRIPAGVSIKVKCRHLNWMPAFIMSYDADINSPGQRPRAGGIHLPRADKSPTVSKIITKVFDLGYYFGAGDEARTRYLHLGKVALYQMSYARMSAKNIITTSSQNVNTCCSIWTPPVWTEPATLRKALFKPAVGVFLC